MATNDIVIGGTTYTGVPSIEVAKSGSGTAKYIDVTDTTAAAEDVASGKAFYSALGVLTQGTASGGGGGGGGGSNLLTDTISNLKSVNTGGTWSGNAYTTTNVTFDFSVTGPGVVTSLTISGLGSGVAFCRIGSGTVLPAGNYIIKNNGCVPGGEFWLQKNEGGSWTTFVQSTSPHDTFEEAFSLNESTTVRLTMRTGSGKQASGTGFPSIVSV